MARPLPPPRRIVAVVNPARPGASPARQQLLRIAAGLNLPAPTLLETTPRQTGTAQARQAIAVGADLVIAMGGDGTVRDVAAGVASSGVPLGIVPIGTANLFARNLGLPLRDPSRAIRLALTGAHREVDLGVARLVTTGADVTERPFLVVCGMGHDARTVRQTPEALKARLRWLAYFVAGTRHLTRPPEPMNLRLDAAPPQRIPAWTVIVGNCGRIPAGIEVIPGARPDDGLLDVLTVSVHHLWQWAPIMLRGLRHQRTNAPALRYDTASTVVITPDTPQPIQLDGDVVDAVLEARITLQPRALRVMVPQGDGV